MLYFIENKYILIIFVAWLMSMTVQKLVLVIKNIDTLEVVERWQFDIQCDKTVSEDR